MKADYVAKTLDAYEASVDKYQSSTSGLVNELELNNLVEQLPDHQHPLLDAGCAFGRDSSWLTNKGYQVVGIDLSGGLLARARQLHPELSFEKMDVRHLTFPDDRFSGIWCNAVLLHLKDDDVVAALKEFYRVLISGGVVAVSFKEGVGSEDKMETFSSNKFRFYNYQTAETAEALLRQAGFEVITSYILNERERFGPDKRDLNWIWCFGKK